MVSGARFRGGVTVISGAPPADGRLVPPGDDEPPQDASTMAPAKAANIGHAFGETRFRNFMPETRTV
ncbi:MAG: hypothetical protein F4186_07180 [Boseongicola sp. SB0676_bin_33]|nr:hypothetical protein [Boseongicola sp. SB0676_bin_33]